MNIYVIKVAPETWTAFKELESGETIDDIKISVGRSSNEAVGALTCGLKMEAADSSIEIDAIYEVKVPTIVENAIFSHNDVGVRQS